MTKQRFDQMARTGIMNGDDEEKVIERHVNNLIQSLYIPVKQDGMIKMVDPERLRLFNIGHEPINWGDLSCNEVMKLSTGEFEITIDEASPGNCPTFCNYIREYMKAYGWETRVLTEW